MAEASSTVLEDEVDLRSSAEICDELEREAESHGMHAGNWHCAVTDCGVRCAWGLGRKNVGKQHWSCCYSVDQDSECPKAKAEAPPPAPEMPPRPSAHHGQTGDVPHYIVHLDAPASKRWAHVIEDFRDSLPVLLNFVDEVVGSVAGGFGGAFFSAFTSLGIVFYKSELAAIAKQLGVSVGKLAMIQIAYEAFAFCTSIVTDVSKEDPQAGPLHIRTMDWEMPELMPLTLEVEFRVKNQPVFVTSTWAGYIGVLTGMRYSSGPEDGWSVSINYRRTGTSVMDVMKNFLKGAIRSWPIGFLVREVLASTPNYGDALTLLTNSSLMAPTYITLCGRKPGQGAIISRNREKAEDVKHLTADEPLVQTNMDHWRPDDPDDAQNICDSVGRRRTAKRILDAMDAKSFDDLWLLTRIPPILAHDTVYTVSMSADMNEYTTQVHANPDDTAAAFERFL